MMMRERNYIASDSLIQPTTCARAVSYSVTLEHKILCEVLDVPPSIVGRAEVALSKASLESVDAATRWPSFDQQARWAVSRP